MTLRNCPRAWEASALRDGRLPPEARPSFEQHCSLCECCRSTAEVVEALGQKLQKAEPALDEMALRRLRRRILRSAQHQVLPRASSWSWGWRILATAVVGSVAALSGVVVNSLRDAPRPAAEQPTPSPGALLAPPPVTMETSPSPIELTVEASPGTLWTRAPQGHEVILIDGTLTLEVHHLTGTPPDSGTSQARVVLQVPDGQIRDLGTRFHIVVQEQETREIAVAEGAVVFQRPGLPDVRVEHGSTWRAHIAMPPVTPKVPAQKRTSLEPRRAPSARAGSSSPDRRDESEAEDAAYLQWVSLVRAGRREAARAAAIDYLRRFPNGFRRSEVEGFVHPPLGGSSSP